MHMTSLCSTAPPIVKAEAHALTTKPFVLGPFLSEHSPFYFPCLLNSIWAILPIPLLLVIQIA